MHSVTHTNVKTPDVRDVFLMTFDDVSRFVLRPEKARGLLRRALEKHLAMVEERSADRARRRKRTGAEAT